MRFGAAFWIQRTSWPALRDACLAAESAGWDTVWLDDHLLSDEGDWAAPKLEGWASLAAVAAVTRRVRLGLLVSANTFRNPGLTAKLGTTLDHVSGGRAVLGLGGAWFEREHEAFGIAEWGAGFGERLDRLDEAMMLIRRLLDGERVTHAGRFYTFSDALCEPRPIQERLPILVGGSGPRKTLRTVARHADAWNGYGSPAQISEALGHLRERCAEEGRPFEAIAKTVTLDNVVIRDSPDEARRWHANITARHGIEEPLDVGGPPERVAEFLRPYAELGIDEVAVVFRDPWDVDTIGRLAEVRAALGG
jgi:alkanesulfonate monooxygenase SsuD/methylene tetrahydromethanopterin reductase-like flavin-dependent oxidoreductase (luciferase family)